MKLVIESARKTDTENMESKCFYVYSEMFFFEDFEAKDIHILTKHSQKPRIRNEFAYFFVIDPLHDNVKYVAYEAFADR